MTKREYKYLRSKRFKVVSGSGYVFKPKKPRCPICGEKITITVTEWEQDKWGWIPTQIEVECTSMPDIDSEEYDEWFNHHYSQPYTDWLPLESRIEDFMRAKIRFSTLK